MSTPGENSAKLAIQYGVTIFKTLRQHTEKITESMIATSALVQTLAEKFPEMADRYEHYRKDGETDSPIAANGRQVCEQFQRIEEQLQKLIDGK
jgi:hypothetical protein